VSLPQNNLVGGDGNAVSLPQNNLVGGDGNAVSLPQNNFVGKRQCRLLILGNINPDATGFDTTTRTK
jgi:hypothetical protein